MRFSLFVHMERYEPTGGSHVTLLRELEELVDMAEESGLAAVWVGEHHAMEFTIAPNPFIHIAHLAARTRRVRLGTGTIIAPFWHPIKLAGEAAMTDIICDGRLDLGLARGAYSFEYERLSPGLDAWTAGARLREMVPALQGLFAGDYAHAGEHWSFPQTTCVPTPVQQPHPPIWIAARDPNSHLFAVENGCNVQVTPLASGDGEVASLMERFDAACTANPTVPRPEIMLLQHMFVSDSAAETVRIAQALSRYYCYFGAWFQNQRPTPRGFIETLSADELAAMDRYTPDVIRENLVIGEADEVIARLKAFEALGYDEYSIWIDSLMTHEQKTRSLELFIERVLPAFS